MRADLRPYLGKSVSVVVDRLLGSLHPDHDDLRYAVNYGYLPGTIGGDGEPINVYLLGVAEPVSEASGIAIGVVLRADDVEDKLIVVPAGVTITVAEMQDRVEFQERFFESRIVTADVNQ